MSGGERLKAALALTFLGREIPQAILLDEPTNNQDLRSNELLESALLRFRALLVAVSQDEQFLANIGLTRVLDFDAARL